VVFFFASGVVLLYASGGGLIYISQLQFVWASFFCLLWWKLWFCGAVLCLVVLLFFFGYIA
jgi:hypothetical protein